MFWFFEIMKGERMTLRVFFSAHPRAAIAFSGGVDSTYLLCAAKEAGADITAYYVRSQFQPAFEFEDAVKMAELTGAHMRVIEVDALADERVRDNPADRCYYCKIHIMGAIRKAAAEDGYDLICDGTNASDDVSDRPGFKALQEFGIRSPLRECELTKDRIRELAREAGLPVWNKPSYACLATRIPAGEEITEEKLRKTELAENGLFEMGFRDFRVRMRGTAALVQVNASQYKEALLRKKEIETAIGTLYTSVTIDDRTR